MIKARKIKIVKDILKNNPDLSAQEIANITELRLSVVKAILKDLDLTIIK